MIPVLLHHFLIMQKSEEETRELAHTVEMASLDRVSIVCETRGENYIQILRTGRRKGLGIRLRSQDGLFI